MNASFRVHSSFVLASRSLFVLEGEITSGMVQIGMRAKLAHSGQEFAATVHGVEFLDRAEGGSGTLEPALTFSYSRQERLDEWVAIDWPGQELELEW